MSANPPSVVTSCSAQGWLAYGNLFVKSFLEHWPDDIDLYIISEDKLPIVGLPRRVQVWDLDENPRAKEFLEKYKTEKWAHGDVHTAVPSNVNRRPRANGGFRFDAYKFSKKVFAIELVAKHMNQGRLFWVDADVVTFASVPVGFIETLLPEWAALSCLARPGYHSECGFVGYNLDNQNAKRFIDEFANLYHSGTVFLLDEWHDSWVFDWLRKKLTILTYDIPHRSKGHPFINSPLGQYMDHLKGARKIKGRTQPVEQVVYRRLEYWK